MNIDEILRRSAPSTPAAPKDELEVLLKRLSNSDHPSRGSWRRRRTLQFFAAAAAGVVAWIQFSQTDSNRQQAAIQGVRPEQVEYTSFVVEAIIEPLELDVAVDGDPIEAVATGTSLL